MPRGLFALVVTWNPDTNDARTSVDFEGMARKVIETGKNNPMHKLKKSSGSTYGEVEWPEIAPLVYPTLDDLAVPSEQGKQKAPLQDKKKFVEDYMDRRAQAKFVSLAYLMPFCGRKLMSVVSRQRITQIVLSQQVQSHSLLHAMLIRVMRQTAAHRSRC